MATYRPKKLNEINSVFDESVKAQEAIKHVGTSLEDKKPQVKESVAACAPKEDGFKETPSQAGVQDITAIADEFILRFGTPERAAATARLRESETIKTKVIPTGTVVKSKTSAAKSETADTKASPAAATDSVPVINRISPEKNLLLEEYMHVMNDDDDDVPAVKHRSKKDKRKRPKGKAAHLPPVKPQLPVAPIAPVVEAPVEEAPAEPEEIPVVQFEVPEELMNLGDKSETQAAENTESEESYEAPAEEVSLAAYDEAEPADEEVYAEQDEYEDIMSRYDYEEEIDELDENSEAFLKGKKSSGKSRKAVRGILSVVLVLTMLSSCFVGVAKLVFGVNTGALVFDRYYIFTSDADLPYMGIERGDLIISENVYPVEGQEFVYADNENETFVFAKQKGTYIDLKGDVIYNAESEGQRNTVYRDNTKGVIIKNIATVGGIVAVASEYYIVIIVFLLCFAAILLLVIIFALGKKNDEENAEEEAAEEETADEYAQAPTEYEDIYSVSDRGDEESEEE